MGTITPQEVSTRSGKRVLLRSAEDRDAATLLALTADTDATASDTSVTMPDEREATIEKRIEWIREHQQKPNSVAIVAELIGGEGRCIGAISFKGWELRRMAHHGHFGISVHSEFQNDGIGRVLVQALLDWASEHPVIEKVCLGVLEPNARARHLYRSLGFTEDYRKEREFKRGPGDYVNDIQMSRWVKPPDDRE